MNDYARTGVDLEFNRGAPEYVRYYPATSARRAGAGSTPGSAMVFAYQAAKHLTGYNG